MSEREEPRAGHAVAPPLAVETIARLLGEFGIDDAALAGLNALGQAIRREAPDALSPVLRESVLAHAERGFFTPFGGGTMSEAQKALADALLRGTLDLQTLQALLARWVLSVNPEEPAGRILRDCVPLQDAFRNGALRVHAPDPSQSAAALAAIDRLVLAQVTIAAVRSGGAARGMSAALTPEYAPFVEQLRALVAERAAGGQSLAVLYVECGIVGRIDGIWGFHAGDTVRSSILGRLRSEVLRSGDLLGEVGRDELACVLDQVADTGVAILAAQRILRTLSAPIRVAGDEIYARPSVGVALYPLHSQSSSSLLQRAKIACTVARGEPERVALYREKQEDPHARLLVHENRLRAAIEHNLLDLVFQPQFRLSDGRLVAVEALLRWRDSELGVVPPSQAIAVAESAGLINEVSWWVINSALRNCASFRSRGLDIRVCINLSANNLRERDLPDFVDRALRTWDLPADSLVIEVTETAVLEIADTTREAFDRFKALGVRLSIDDFGTGYSSMSYLANMPFDEMKIDLSFVRDMLRVPSHERIVRSMIDLAHNLGLVVVAEGVEEEAVAKRLAALGCDSMQGYFASRPLDPEKLVAVYGPGASA